MLRHLSRTVAAVATVVAALLAVAGCGASADSSSATGGTQVRVAFSDDGCTPDPASVPAGAVRFQVSNKNASRVTEIELLSNGRILGEKENLTPGLSGQFSLRLAPGRYTVSCPNAKTDQAPLTVTGTKNASPSGPDPKAAAGVRAYTAYLQGQSATLVTQTTAFVGAVKAGNIAKAKALYAPTRSSYERIEPVAETFGTLDPAIDARANDVVSPQQWTGFHRLEKALWADRSLTGMTPIADKLLADVTRLHGLVKTVTLQPAQIANGAVELLGEVAASKITGEEERYSHTDLWDFDANVAGAREAFDVLRPAVTAKNTALAGTIDKQFAGVLALLAKYRTTGGYVNFSTVGQPQRRTMTIAVNALAESLSKVAPLVA